MENNSDNYSELEQSSVIKQLKNLVKGISPSTNKKSNDSQFQEQQHSKIEKLNRKFRIAISPDKKDYDPDTLGKLIIEN